MKPEQKLDQWQNWGLIGLRFVFLIYATIQLLAIPEAQRGVLNEIIITLVIGVISTVVLIIPVLFPGMMVIFNPLVLLGDWVMMGLLIYVGRAEATLSVVYGVMLIFTSAFRLRGFWGIIHSVGLIAVFLIIKQQFVPQPLIERAEISLPLQIALMVVSAVVANVWSYILHIQFSDAKKQINFAETQKIEQVNAMQKRTKVIYDMAAILGTTLSYQKILEAAMDAGWLGLRNEKRRNSDDLVSMALLFDADDDKLHVSVSKGLARRDEERAIAGVDGCVGMALAECIPVIVNERAKKDLELGSFISFQDVMSVLVIPLRAGFDNFGVLVYGSRSSDAFTDEHLELLTAIGTQATVALQNTLLYQNLLTERNKIIEVEEEARKKLASDLHDGPTQDVSAIAMRMNMLPRMIERAPQDVNNEIKRIEELARKVTKEIRHMLFTLRPLVLENQGLAAALDQLAAKMKETHGQNVAVRVSREVEQILDEHQQGVIFYIVDEAVGNARKHAKAELITVSINRQDEVVVVTIGDNGVGFDAKAAEENARNRAGHLGMVNLRDRAEILGGALKIDSARGKGTLVTVIVPIRPDMQIGANKDNQRRGNTKLEQKTLSRLGNLDDRDFYR